ncbi:MAG TPA: GDP-mannose 4,6-dehydratase, partial [Chitinophagaceae bacterium]
GADCIAESFYRSFGTPVTIVRPFNTYGPRQSARAVIPTIITQLLQGKTEISLGAIHPTRDLVYVKDTAAGFISIACAEETIGMDLNLATGEEISIGDLAQMIIGRINPAAKIATDLQRLRPEKSEVDRLLGNSEGAARLAGWKPGHSLTNGIDLTIQWFSDKKNLERYKHDIYNL